MTEKELHQLRRQDLLQMLLTQSKEVARLKAENDEFEDRLEAYQETLVRLKDRLDAKDEQIEHLKKRLDEKDAIIQKLKSGPGTQASVLLETLQSLQRSVDRLEKKSGL